MRHLTLIRIRNEDFDYTKYGLENNYFTIDVSQALNYGKSIGFTQYALLDGTTRVDNISREPGTVTYQGLLGEVRGGGDGANFVKATLSKTRLQNQMDLLEALRDQAIFLDFITDERTYRDYMISGVNFGKSKFDEITVSINTREVITFGDTIDVIETDRTYEMSPYQRSLILDEFYMRNIESDTDLVKELNRVISSSILTTPFIITVGSVDINANAIIAPYQYLKQNVNVNLDRVGDSFITPFTNRLFNKANAGEIITGAAVDNYYLHISTPMMNQGASIYKTKYTLNPSRNLEFLQRSHTCLNIRLKKDNQTVYSALKGEVVKEPRYSDINNGVHFLNRSGSTGDIISSPEYSMAFVRKQKNDSYSLLPNLLGNDSRGYLYSATYEVGSGSVFKLQPVLVYIHNAAWVKIKKELNRVWSESAYFRNKRLVV